MQPERNKVVMDTNIVVSAAISIDGTPAKIFELFLNKKIVNYTSEEIINEIEEVINRPAFREYISDEYKKFILDSFKLNSVVVKPAIDEEAVPEDEADNKFVNCALSVKADIVSGDKHLKGLKHYKGINIWDAKAFLNRFEE